MSRPKNDTLALLTQARRLLVQPRPAWASDESWSCLAMLNDSLLLDIAKLVGGQDESEISRAAAATTLGVSWPTVFQYLHGASSADLRWHARGRELARADQAAGALLPLGGLAPVLVGRVRQELDSETDERVRAFAGLSLCQGYESEIRDATNRARQTP